MSQLPYLPRLHRATGLVAAVAATMAIMGAVAVIFESAAATPWVTADRSSAVARCDQERQPAARHACIRTALSAPPVTIVVSR